VNRKLRVDVALGDKNKKFWLVFQSFLKLALRAAGEKVGVCATRGGDVERQEKK